MYLIGCQSQGQHAPTADFLFVIIIIIIITNLITIVRKEFLNLFSFVVLIDVYPNHELKLLEKTLTKLRIKKRFKNLFRTIVTKFVV